MPTASDAPTPVRFRLQAVGVEQYATASLAGEDYFAVNDLSVAYEFELLPSNRLITSFPRFSFLDDEGKEAVILQAKVQFDVHEEDWPTLFREDESIALPVYLLQHLAVIATGFARGVLHEKLSREKGYERVMLPIIPVVDYITEELIFAA